MQRRLWSSAFHQHPTRPKGRGRAGGTPAVQTAPGAPGPGPLPSRPLACTRRAGRPQIAASNSADAGPGAGRVGRSSRLSRRGTQGCLAQTLLEFGKALLRALSPDPAPPPPSGASLPGPGAHS